MLVTKLNRPKVGEFETVGFARAKLAPFAHLENPLVVVLARATGMLLIIWLLLAGVLLAVRTSSGSVRNLTCSQLVLVAVALAAAAHMVRGTWRLAEPDWSARCQVLPVLFTSVAMAIWTLALGMPSESSVGPMLFAVIVAGEEAWEWRQVIRRNRRTAHSSPLARTSGDHVVQQFTRVVSADGEERIEGSVAVSVDCGSRIGSAHVGFCPPLTERPDFELRPTTDNRVVLKVGQLLPQGARIEVKLPAPAEAAKIVRVQFVARTRSDRDGPMAV